MDENEFFDRRYVSPDQLSFPGMEPEASTTLDGTPLLPDLTPVETVTENIFQIGLYEWELLDQFKATPTVLVKLTDYRWLITNNQLSFQKFSTINSIVLSESFREQVGNYILLQGREGFYYLVDAIQMNPFLGQILDAPPPVTEI